VHLFNVLKVLLYVTLPEVHDSFVIKIFKEKFHLLAGRFQVSIATFVIKNMF
jgi:hypothetical protein